jgi:hypothetical protein
MTDNARKTGPALEAHFQFLMWLVPAVEKFPRTQKFRVVLGVRADLRLPHGFMNSWQRPSLRPSQYSPVPKPI